jgi:hypothetical protein
MKKQQPSKSETRLTHWEPPTKIINTIHGNMSYLEWCDAEGLRLVDARLYGDYEIRRNRDGMCALFMINATEG